MNLLRKIRCWIGRHDLGYFLLLSDKRCLVEACKHCYVVNRIKKLNNRELREFNDMRRKSPVPWPELPISKEKALQF